MMNAEELCRHRREQYRLRRNIYNNLSHLKIEIHAQIIFEDLNCWNKPSQ